MTQLLLAVPFEVIEARPTRHAPHVAVGIVDVPIGEHAICVSRNAGSKEAVAVVCVLVVAAPARLQTRNSDLAVLHAQDVAHGVVLVVLLISDERLNVARVGQGTALDVIPCGLLARMLAARRLH